MQLRIPKNDTKDLAALAAAIHKRVKGSSFKKTDFALALLTRDPASWIVPAYIAGGLKWLEDAVTPVEAPTSSAPASEPVTVPLEPPVPQETGQ